MVSKRIGQHKPSMIGLATRAAAVSNSSPLKGDERIQPPRKHVTIEAMQAAACA